MTGSSEGAGADRRAATPIGREGPGRLEQLTTVRGLAVTCVVGFHLFESTTHWLRGGWIGVDVFFVLSGFLVERVLLTSPRRGRTRSFLLRRGARLVPALVPVLVASLLVAVVWPAASARRIDVVKPAPGGPRPVLQAIGQVVDGTWNLALAHGATTAPALGHLWSLTIEAQVYVLWPVAFAPLRRRRARLAVLAGAAVIGAAYPLLAHPSHAAAYFGTVPHVVGFALGALVAELRPGREEDRGRRALALVALAALGVLVAELGEGPVKYTYGTTIASVLAAAVVLGAIGSGGALLAAGWSRPLRWLGDRSYGLYLWHFPLLAWARPFPGGVHVAVLGLAVVLAACSYSWIELPCTRWAAARSRRWTTAATTTAVAWSPGTASSVS